MNALRTAAFAVLLGGCVVAQSHFGKATLRWTVDERTDAAVCEAQGAPWTRIHLRDEQGVIAAMRDARCTDFEASFALLHEGWYTASVSLVDDLGFALAPALEVPPFLVDGGGTTIAVVHFPALATPVNQ